MASNEEMIDDLMAKDAGLSGWEIDFLESIDGIVESEHELTTAQEEKLIQIWKDKA